MGTGEPLPFDPIAEATRQWEAHGWAAAAPGMAAVTSVMRVQQLMVARVEEVLRPHDLTFARYELLMLLSFSRAGSMPMSRIGAPAAGASDVGDERRRPCEARGLVRRVPHPSDRRADARRDHAVRAGAGPEGDRGAEPRGVHRSSGCRRPTSSRWSRCSLRFRSARGDF
jgi:hypothetical protein